MFSTLDDVNVDAPAASLGLIKDTQKLKNKRLAEKRCKRSNTLLKKTKELHSFTVLSVITIIKDKFGKITFAGSPDFEESFVKGEPLAAVENHQLQKYVSEELSLESSLPEPKPIPDEVAQRVPAQLKHSIPGAAPAVSSLVADFVVARGSSATRVLSPAKENLDGQPAAKRQ